MDLMKALKRFSAQMNCRRGCVPSPPEQIAAGRRQEVAGMGWWRWSLVQPKTKLGKTNTGQHGEVPTWREETESLEPTAKDYWGSLCRVVKSKMSEKLHGDKYIWREHHNFTCVSLDCHGMWVTSVETSAVRNSKLDPKTVREAEKK